MIRGTRPSGLGARLFAAQALIVLAGAATLVVAAVLVAPGLFHAHLKRAVGTVDPQMADHIDRAFGAAVLIALGTAIGASLLMTMAVSWVLTRRITRPVQQLADAAERIAAGAYDTAVPTSGLGVEFDRLDASFNTMAEELARTERRRRELLADLAHELRTPLATLDGFLEGLEDGVLPANDQTWTTMRDQTTRLSRLVRDVGTVSAAEERRLEFAEEPIDLASLVGDAVRDVEPRFREKGVGLTFASVAPDTRVTGDRDRLREVIDNLLTNALRHTSAEGRVTVEVGADDGTVMLEVADDGEGIDPRHLPHLFDRFFRGDSARVHDTDGSGIGLTIARALVAAHGGTITATSPGAGRGARFVVCLPRPREN